MRLLVLAMAVLALTCAGLAAYRNRNWHDLSKYEKLVGIYVVLIIGWPQVMTFLIAPLLWTKAESAGPLHPTLWYLPSFLFAAVYFVHGLFTEGSRFDLAALVQYSSLAISLTFLMVGSMRTSDIAKLVIPMTLLLVTLVKPTDIRGSAAVGWGCRASLVLISGAVLAAVLVNPGRVLESCRLDKCGIAGETMTSPFAGNGNILGLAVAMIIPFAIANIDLVSTFSILAAVGLTAEIAGGRTAEVGIVTAALLVLCILLMPSQRRPILITGFAMALAFSIVPAIYPFGGSQFTFRGFLWNEGRLAVADRPVLGSGPTAWFTMAQTSIHNLNYSPPNAWLDITLSIGVTGLLVLVLAVAVKFYLADSAERDTLLFYFTTLLAISALESIYVPYLLAILPFVAILPFLGGPGRPIGPVEEKSKNHEAVGRHRAMSGKGNDGNTE